MAWGARLGLKRSISAVLLERAAGLNGLGSPFGIETEKLLAKLMQEYKG